MSKYFKVEVTKIYTVEIDDNNYTTETLVTHKSLKFKKIIKRTNLLVE